MSCDISCMVTDLPICIPALGVIISVTGKRRYNIRLWKTFTDCFNCLPVAAILDEKIFCCHGGKLLFECLSPVAAH